MRPRYLPLLLFACVFAPAGHAQLVVNLSQKTLAEFHSYAAKVHSELEERWSLRKPFLAIDDDPGARKAVLAGDIFIRQQNGEKPVSITDGLVHDWLGAIYIPNTTPEQVVRILEDFDNHHKIYPAVAKSRLLSRQGHHVTGYWQLQQKGLVPVVLDLEEEATYQQLSPGKWKGEAQSRKIQEHDAGLFSSGKLFPPDEGHGYLWRLYSYWTLEEYEHGVLAECRTLSLSRDVPPGLNWAVGPYIQKMPRQSLESTLKQTRAALEK